MCFKSIGPKGSSKSNFVKCRENFECSGSQLLLTVTPMKMNMIVIVACIFVYANSIFGDFVHDDIPAITENPDVQGKTTISELFTNDFWGKPMGHPDSHKSYRPITILTFRWECYLLGTILPMCCHLTNVLLHILVTLLYIKVLRSCLHLASSQAFVSGIIFAIHPIHTEAVSGLVGRADILSALMFLCAFYSYHMLLYCTNKTKSLHWRNAVLASILIGVLCKETSLTVVGVCALWDVFLCIISQKSPQESLLSARALGRRIAVLLILTFVILFVRLLIMRGSPLFSKQDNPVSFSRSLQARFLTYSYLPAMSLWLILNPHLLSYDWQMGSIPPIKYLTDPRNSGSLVLYLCIFALVVRAAKEKTREASAILWSLLVVVISFLPASNIFFRVGFVLAERILYTPSLGVCTIVGIGFIKIWNRYQHRCVDGSRNTTTRFIAWFMTIVLILLATRTIIRNRDWVSRESLLRSGLKVLPNNAKMHYNFANLARDNNSTDLAVKYYKKAINLWPDYASAHNNLGVVLMEKLRSEEAEMHFHLALFYHPHHLHATTNLSILLRRSNRKREAISLLRESFWCQLSSVAVSYRDQCKEIWQIGLQLASLYAESGDSEAEENIFLRLITEFPYETNVHASYGDFLVRQNRTEDAKKYFESALSMTPDHTHSLESYASMMKQESRHYEAQHLYRRALEIAWNEDTASSLVKSYIQKQQLLEAEELISKILLHNPVSFQANIYLAQVRLQQGRLTESETILNESLKIWPENRQALHSLSLVVLKQNRSEESLYFAKAAAKDCDDPKDFCACVHTHLADLFHTKASMERAILSYQTAVELKPTLARAHMNLGAIYHSQGNYSKAMVHYTEALQHEPSNSILLENIWKLKRVYHANPDIVFGAMT